jgi:ATP-dependent helicase/nuclease subunit B
MLEVIIGPPASGKTTACIKRLHELTKNKQHVIWVGEPHQRERTIHRWLTEPGTILNARYFTYQQLYYRILQNHPNVKPLSSPGQTVAHTAQAIRTTLNRTPTPGETTLYQAGIRELKRLQPTKQSLKQLTRNNNITKLNEIHQTYQQITQHTWDRDDYRTQTQQTLQTTPPTNLPTIIIDGIIDHDPADLRIINTLAEHTHIIITFEQEPTGLNVTHRKTTHPTPQQPPRTLAFPNAVKEVRWVLRSVKADLAAGVAPHDVAIITAPELKSSFLALSRESGVPLHDATPKTLANTSAARLLTRLLRIPTNPEPMNLAAHPELRELSEIIHALNVTGSVAAEEVADGHGFGSVFRRVKSDLTPPDDVTEVEAWIVKTLELLPVIDASLTGDSYAVIRGSIRQRGVEASTIASGVSMLPWWEHLLSLYRDPTEHPRGVGVHTVEEVVGLRFARVYFTQANAHQHRVAGGEDYFFSEELRSVPAASDKGSLPKRFRGLSNVVQRHALHRGDVVTVSFVTANQEGPTIANDAVVGDVSEVPLLPAANVREALGVKARRHVTRVVPVISVPVRVRGKTLETQVTCGFRARFEDLAGGSTRPAWVELIGGVTRQPRLTVEVNDGLVKQFPMFAGWLRENFGFFSKFEFRHEIPLSPEVTVPVVTGLIHGSLRGDRNDISVMWFTNPEVTDVKKLADKVLSSWEKVAVIRALLTTHGFERVHVFVAPVGGVTQRVLSFASVDGDDVMNVNKVRTKPNFVPALNQFMAGDTTAKPGFHCRTCRVVDVCRTRGD